MADRSLPSAEVIQIRDYQTREELDEILMRSISRELGFEWSGDDGILNTAEPIYFSDDGDCA